MSVVYVRELDESDQEVVRIVGEADDPALTVSQCLRVGVRALRAAHVSVDVDVIERSFQELESRFETRVTAAVDEIARTTIGLLDEEDGALSGMLGTFQSELTEILGDTFDPDSRSSVLAKIEGLVDATEEAYELTTGKGFDSRISSTSASASSPRPTAICTRPPARNAVPPRRRWATRSSRSTGKTRTASTRATRASRSR